MKRLICLLLTLCCLLPTFCFAQDSISTTNVSTVRYRGRTSVPSASTTGNAVCYFDKTAGKLKCSQNGGAFADASSSGLTVGTTTITSGTTTRVLYDNAGVLGEYTVSGSGSVAMTTSPTFVTPTLGVATATSINGLTITTSTGTLTIQNGVTVNSGAVGGTLGTGAFQPTGATLALDNLASVNINTSLLFQTGLDVGSTTKPAHDLYLHGGGTYGTNYFKMTGTPTAPRVVTLPDLASYTVAQITNGQTFAGVQTFSGSIDVPTLTGTSSITGAASNLTITSGTGNSRTMIFRTTTSGGTATAFLTGNADQSSTFAGGLATPVNSGRSGGYFFTGGVTGMFAQASNRLGFISNNIQYLEFSGSKINLAGTFPLVWTASADPEDTADTGLSRISAGVIGAGTGAAGSFAADLKFNNALVTSTTDSTTTTSGALQVAGGAAIIKRVFIPGITASAGLQTAVLCQSSGGEMIADSVACLASSGRFKENVKPLTVGIDEVMKLRPVSYRYKPEGIFSKNLNFQRERVGFIAEDVAQVDPRFVGYEADGLTPRTVGYDTMVPLLVKAIQELYLEVERLKSDLRLLGQKR